MLGELKKNRGFSSLNKSVASSIKVISLNCSEFKWGFLVHDLHCCQLLKNHKLRLPRQGDQFKIKTLGWGWREGNKDNFFFFAFWLVTDCILKLFLQSSGLNNDTEKKNENWLLSKHVSQRQSITFKHHGLEIHKNVSFNKLIQRL